MRIIINSYPAEYEYGVKVSEAYSEAAIFDMPTLTISQLDELSEILNVDILIL